MDFSMAVVVTDGVPVDRVMINDESILLPPESHSVNRCENYGKVFEIPVENDNIERDTKGAGRQRRQTLLLIQRPLIQMQPMQGYSYYSLAGMGCQQ
jgi:hypothetical protein